MSCSSSGHIQEINKATLGGGTVKFIVMSYQKAKLSLIKGIVLPLAQDFLWVENLKIEVWATCFFSSSSHYFFPTQQLFLALLQGRELEKRILPYQVAEAVM